MGDASNSGFGFTAGAISLAASDQLLTLSRPCALTPYEEFVCHPLYAL
jgi:hypothetical protein